MPDLPDDTSPDVVRAAEILDETRAVAVYATDTAVELELGDLATLYVAVESARAELGRASKAVAKALRDEMDAAHVWRFQRDDLPAPIVCHAPAEKQRWDGPEIGRRIGAKCSDEQADPETGELPPVGVICEHVAEAVVDAAGMTPSKAWRKQKLARWGIPLDDVYSTQRGEPTVRFEEPK